MGILLRRQVHSLALFEQMYVYHCFGCVLAVKLMSKFAFKC